jgi:hypothetical protein
MFLDYSYEENDIYQGRAPAFKDALANKLSGMSFLPVSWHKVLLRIEAV